MKKVYITPSIRMMEALTEEMIAGSPLDITGDSGEAEVYNEDATGEALSRSTLWDEE